MQKIAKKLLKEFETNKLHVIASHGGWLRSLGCKIDENLSACVVKISKQELEKMGQSGKINFEPYIVYSVAPNSDKGDIFYDNGLARIYKGLQYNQEYDFPDDWKVTGFSYNYKKQYVS